MANGQRWPEENASIFLPMVARGTQTAIQVCNSLGVAVSLKPYGSIIFHGALQGQTDGAPVKV